MNNTTTKAAELPEARRFTKKPVTIDAILWTGKNIDSVMNFMAWRNASYDEKTGLVIHTLEGNLYANVGDWIIKGVKGEFYACKPDIFEATYSPAAQVEALSAAPRTPTVEQVEDEISMGHGAWDMVDPQELIGTVLRLSVAASPPAEQQAQPGAVYAELHEPDATTVGLGAVWNRHSMRDFADRTHALRMQAAPKAAPGEQFDPEGFRAWVLAL